MRKIIRTVNIEEEKWLEFKEKYSPLGMSKRIRELIRLDIEGKLDTVIVTPSLDIRKDKTD